MKLMPSSTARLSTRDAVCSSLPILCMNDFSSASPNVMPPKQSSETFTPALPSRLYFIVSPCRPNERDAMALIPLLEGDNRQRRPSARHGGISPHIGALERDRF